MPGRQQQHSTSTAESLSLVQETRPDAGRQRTVASAVCTVPLFDRGSHLKGPADSTLDLPLSQIGERTVRPRQTIYRAGDPLDGILAICDGWAARVCRLSDGRRQILSFILPWDLVSANGAFAEQLNFFVEAITPVRYVWYDRADLDHKLAANPGLIKNLMKLCLADVQDIAQLATDLGCCRAEERIARLLLNLEGRLKARGLIDDQKFALPLRQQHIADATGLTPVHVNRVITSLRNEAVISIADGMVHILDRRRFQRIADGG